MIKRTTVGAALFLFAMCIGGCGCVTAKPAPSPPPTQPEPSPEPEEETCTSCLEICYPSIDEDGDQIMVCESECQAGNGCPMHKAKERAEAIRRLFEPPTSPKPPHQNQSGEGEGDGGSRTLEL